MLGTAASAFYITAVQQWQFDMLVGALLVHTVTAAPGGGSGGGSTGRFAVNESCLWLTRLSEFLPLCFALCGHIPVVLFSPTACMLWPYPCSADATLPHACCGPIPVVLFSLYRMHAVALSL